VLISEAFGKFKAKQKNVNWSVSSFSDNNELILSLWDQYFKPTQNGGVKTMTYIDRTSRWSGNGNKEFIVNLNLAHKENSIIRAIIAKTNRPDIVEHGGDASTLVNTFNPKGDWIGELKVWDGDNFEIEFSREI
jgi:hypothetical protein